MNTLVPRQASKPIYRLMDRGFIPPSLIVLPFLRLSCTPFCPVLPSDHHRVSNIDFNFAHHQIDSVVVAIPPGFEMEFLPEDHSDSSKYGAYSIHYNVKGNSIYCIADRVVYKGTYPPEEYEAIRKFT